MTDPMALLASLLSLAAGCCLSLVAYGLDRQLKNLLPSRAFRRWHTQLPPPSRDLAAHILFYFSSVLPAHWQSRLHSDRGARLARRLHLLVGLAFFLTMIGVSLLSIAVAPVYR